MAHARHRRTRAGRDATAQLRGAAHPNPPPQSATRGGRPAREPPPHRAGTDGPRRAHSVSDSTRPWGQAPGWSRAAIFHPRRCARRPCVSLSARPGAVGRTRAGGRRNSEQPPASRTPPAVSATGATRGTTPAAVRFAGRWRPEPHDQGAKPTPGRDAADRPSRGGADFAGVDAGRAAGADGRQTRRRWNAPAARASTPADRDAAWNRSPPSAATAAPPGPRAPGSPPRAASGRRRRHRPSRTARPAPRPPGSSCRAGPSPASRRRRQPSATSPQSRALTSLRRSPP